MTDDDKALVERLRWSDGWFFENPWDHVVFASDDPLEAADRIEAQAAEIERLRGIGLHLVQHINWVTNGLPDLLEDACLTDEEGVINAAIAAATEARAALEKQP